MQCHWLGITRRRKVYNDVISLVKKIETTDEYGDPVSELPEREVFAELKSIGQSEFYQAQASGMKAEIKFILSDYEDYEEEQLIKYNNQLYDVIRTYKSGIQLEITCKRGVNNGST